MLQTIDKSGTLRKREKQMIAYADAIVIITNQKYDLEEVFEAIMRGEV